MIRIKWELIRRESLIDTSRSGSCIDPRHTPSCVRRIRVARTVLDAGGIRCDLCGHEFRPAA